MRRTHYSTADDPAFVMTPLRYLSVVLLPAGLIFLGAVAYLALNPVIAAPPDQAAIFGLPGIISLLIGIAFWRESRTIVWDDFTGRFVCRVRPLLSYTRVFAPDDVWLEIGTVDPGYKRAGGEPTLEVRASRDRGRSGAPYRWIIYIGHGTTDCLEVIPRLPAPFRELELRGDPNHWHAQSGLPAPPD